MADITIDYCLKTIKNAPDKEKVKYYVEIVQQEINSYMDASASISAAELQIAPAVISLALPSLPIAATALLKEAKRLDILLDEALAYLPETAEAT
jgi:hypothetical protein